MQEAIYYILTLVITFTGVGLVNAALRRRPVEMAAIKREWNNTAEQRAATFALRGRAEG